MNLKIPWNIPNILSVYRLLSFPFVLAIALLGYEKLFVILICINLITDVLDGLIARTFNMKTEIGAKLDSIADTGTFILAFLGLYLFRWNVLQDYAFPFLLFVSLFIVCNLLSLLKFKRLPSLHLYSWKIGGYIQGTFLFTIFAFGFYAPLFYLMIVWSVLAISEHIIIQLIIKEMMSNAKGLYWVLKDKKQGKNL
jgi:CDP-diacylglycerol--glycerol-3-phosphate 3-phosphatidyltransferase